MERFLGTKSSLNYKVTKIHGITVFGFRGLPFKETSCWELFATNFEN
jgi:hypothetical protein